MDIDQIARFIVEHPSIKEKASISESYAPASLTSETVALGDDAAAIPDGDEWMLMAGEAMLPSFIEKDPWFAGYSAVMVNISDIAAMGGRPLAIVDLIWQHDSASTKELWAGMQAASEAYGVPIVGGHTSQGCEQGTFLGATILGRATNLITSFDAQPGEQLLFVVDKRASYRGTAPFWNASVGSPKERLKGDLELLPLLSEKRLCSVGKDVSNGGLFGTLVMLLECSKVGAVVDLDRIQNPEGVDLLKWLISFPSFGYILSVESNKVSEIKDLFESRGIECEAIGTITKEAILKIKSGNEHRMVWSIEEGLLESSFG